MAFWLFITLTFVIEHCQVNKIGQSDGPVSERADEVAFKTET